MARKHPATSTLGMLALQSNFNADRPKDSSQWQRRFQIQFLFPK